MIRIQRPSEMPRYLSSTVVDNARLEAATWAELQVARRNMGTAQQPFRFQPDLIQHRDVRNALATAFNRKCSFCETPFQSGSLPNVALFRPPSAATDADGISSAPHYAWLAYEWANLYLACGNCDRAKGNRFPIGSVHRAPLGATGDELAREKPLLLDPCQDDPDAHLVFTDDGRVSGATARGRATIDTFDLNRTSLLPERARLIAAAIAQWGEGAPDDVMGDAVPFAGAVRQAVRRRLAKEPVTGGGLPSDSSPGIVDAGDHYLVGEIKLTKRSARQEQAAVGAESEANAAQADFSLHDPTASKVYFATSKYIESIEIVNWKPVRQLALSLPTGASHRASWLMLLGENGAGKSSILQGVALALLGQDGRDALQLDAGDFVRNGAQRATVTVRISGVPEPCVVTARKGESRFGGSESPKALVLGYGATRLLPRAGRVAPDHGPDAIADVDNLFDPFVPMADANEWLLGLTDSKFTAAVRALRDLLGLKDSDGFARYRAAGEVRCRTLGSTVSIDSLSDGYQSVVALAADVMAVLLNRWDDLSAAEGIVVLDELGAHLHPRWRMQVVARLRGLFPRVQFLATTHDPLCLMGLDDNEIAVIERLDDKHRTVVVQTDLPPIAGRRVDQLLTSEWFGLPSARDPQIAEAFEEYYALLALRSPTETQRDRIAVLADQLDSNRLLGDTPRERMVYESADRYLAGARTAPASGPGNDAALAMLRDIWADESPARFDPPGG